MGELSRPPAGYTPLSVHPPTHDCGHTCASRWHQGCHERTTGLSLGGVHKARVSVAVASRRLEGHSHSIFRFRHSRCDLSAQYASVRLPAGTAFHRNAAGARALFHTTWPCESHRKPIHQASLSTEPAGTAFSRRPKLRFPEL